MECYNVTGEQDNDDQLDINIPESEGMCAVEGIGISSDQFLSPLKIKKVNIGSPKNPKFANIGDCWDVTLWRRSLNFCMNSMIYSLLNS